MYKFIFVGKVGHLFQFKSVAGGFTMTLSATQIMFGDVKNRYYVSMLRKKKKGKEESDTNVRNCSKKRKLD